MRLLDPLRIEIQKVRAPGAAPVALTRRTIEPSKCSGSSPPSQGTCWRADPHVSSRAADRSGRHRNLWHEPPHSAQHSPVKGQDRDQRSAAVRSTSSAAPARTARGKRELRLLRERLDLDGDAHPAAAARADHVSTSPDAVCARRPRLLLRNCAAYALPAVSAHIVRLQCA